MNTFILVLALTGGIVGHVSAILSLTGASCLEELDAQVIDVSTTLRTSCGS